jgi:hypothetical protein
MTESQDDFEGRFAEDFRAYLAEGVPKTDANAVAREAMTRTQRRAGWGRPVAGVASVLITALAVVAIVLVRAGVPPVGSSPSPAAVGSATPTQASAELGVLRITCQAPVVPGWCLQPLAWAIEHLPTGHAGVASVTIMPINLCPTASPCYGPPHRDESWVAFTLRDASSLGMWVVEMFGIPHVQSIEAGGTPPPSAEPVTGAFTLQCGDIPDDTCAGAAGGATEVVPNKPPQAVLVQRGESDRYLVTVTYQDGTHVTTAVAPDTTRYGMGWSAVSSAAPPTDDGRVTETRAGVTFTRPASWFVVQPPENFIPGPFLWLSSEPMSTPCPMTADFPVGCLPGEVLPDGGILITFSSGATVTPQAPTALPIATFASDTCARAGGEAVSTRIGSTYIAACMRGPLAATTLDAFFGSLSQSLKR